MREYPSDIAFTPAVKAVQTTKGSRASYAKVERRGWRTRVTPDLAEFLAGVSSDIPWHVTAFHKDYKMTDPENTSAETLMRAAEIGKRAGLRYVYAGNLPGMVGDWENTRCPKCKQLLIERHGYLITGYFLTPQGCCPSCGASIPGRWDPAFRRQITDRPFVPGMRPQSDLLVLNS